MSDFEYLIDMLEYFGIAYETGHYGGDDKDDIWVTIEESDLRFSPEGDTKML
jgi:hypothetical protein